MSRPAGRTAIGSYGFLTRAHLQHQVAAQEAVDRDAAPIAQRIALAEATVTDFDARIAQLVDMVKAATGGDGRRPQWRWLADKAPRAPRSWLNASRPPSGWPTWVQQANIETQHARIIAEAGPALYLAKPF